MVEKNEPISASVETEPVSRCCHHWNIQPAVGPVSEGMCQNCGEVREFKNSIAYESNSSEFGALTEALEDADSKVRS